MENHGGALEPQQPGGGRRGAQAPGLQISLLGQLTVRQDGQTLPLPQSKKCRALIAYLAATGRAHRRERLCELFWEVPDDPKGALRWSLSKIRRVLGEALVAERENVSIDSARASTDAAETLRAAPELAALETLELERLGGNCGAEFGEGLDLPRCPDFQAWLAAIREDVRRAQVAILSELARRLAGDPERSLPFARLHVARDPLDELARIQLVTNLAAAGRTDEAERQRALAVAALQESGIAIPAGLSRPVRQTAAAPPSPQTPKPSIQRVQFCTTPDCTRIAYSAVGSGPPLVKTANWMSHLEHEWENPFLRPWLVELSRHNMLVRYDMRGNGLSSRRPPELSLSAFVEDLETVTAAATDGPFDLVGISQGAPVAIAFAVKHPEKVRKLILFGGFAMGWDYTESAEVRARWEAMVTLTGVGWGQDNPAYRPMFTSALAPGATAEQANWFNHLQRVSATPEEAQRLQRAIGALDVRDILGRVVAPTIIFHSRGDAMVPFGNARYLAANIPGAELVGLDSDNHVLIEGEPAWGLFLEHLRDFLSR